MTKECLEWNRDFKSEVCDDWIKTFVRLITLSIEIDIFPRNHSSLWVISDVLIFRFPLRRDILLDESFLPRAKPFVWLKNVENKSIESRKMFWAASLTICDMEHKFVKFWVIDRDGEILCVFRHSRDELKGFRGCWEQFMNGKLL